MEHSPGRVARGSRRSYDPRVTQGGSGSAAPVAGDAPVSGPSVPDRNLALELVRVTEAAALGCGRWIGRGDKEAADQAAVDAMRAMLDTVTMAGVVIIGEGEKDKAPMLYNGEEVGNGDPPEVDVAVDPLEGTRLTSVGQPNAISVIAVAERGTMFFPGAAVYMDKIAAGAEVADAIDIDASPSENVDGAAKAKGVKPSEIAVVVLDRDRNADLIAELREVGAKVNLITDGDVAPAVAAARLGTGVDLMMGIGGTPEGVIAAAAVKCLGGVVQGRLWPRDEEERQKLVDAGYDPDRVLTTDDLVGGDNIFVAATGVTDGALLRGVRYTKDGALTDSIVMRSRSGTVRRVQAEHVLEKLSRLSGREYR
jgi:fructose-1,6-bisphosphatase II